MNPLEQALINTGWHKTSIYIFPTENSIKTLYLYLPSKKYDTTNRYSLREWHSDTLELHVAMWRAGYWQEYGKWKFCNARVIPAIPRTKQEIGYGSTGEVRQPSGYFYGRFGVEYACPYTNPESCPEIR